MIGFIGGGNMAGALIGGIKERADEDISVYDRKGERLEYLKRKYRVKVAKSNVEVVASSDVLVLAVKPGNMAEVLQEIKGHVGREHLVVSIAAGIGIDFIREGLGVKRIIRTMPNAPALVGEGVTVLSPLEGVSKRDLKRARDIFDAVGSTLVMEEEKLDAVTAVSGSGPAFFAHFIEALIDAGIMMGLSAGEAEDLALRTGSGTIRMLSEGMDTLELKRMVTSPGGTTAEGLYVLEGHALKAAVMEAVEAATIKSMELSGR
ncbi:pyrroline-5-carboxylate reductase [bacterium BMS3Bbin06]|nr:pyrroline-5-carboxylate reductase [bacterium BMS3Bbin06]HDO35992.1 pyrroline-5-carboxylate reductase [Nitrospirota bacterium]HDY72091.1 pyrroline-5-carboxylate reductase [Nitrospirota bacterium]